MDKKIIIAIAIVVVAVLGYVGYTVSEDKAFDFDGVDQAEKIDIDLGSDIDDLENMDFEEAEGGSLEVEIVESEESEAEIEAGLDELENMDF